jgi:type VI secretion system secreted protein VgrG
MSAHGRFWLHVDGSPGPLAVRELVGRERANTLSRWTIDLEPGVAIDTHDVLDLRASLVIEGSTSGRRVVHGHISRIEDRVAAGVRVTLEPAFARLRRTAMWRMFHGLDVITIATQILGEHFITFRLRIKHAYPKLPHVAQRGESDYEFICRILAREGVFFYFDHPQDFATSSDETNSGSGDVLVLADHATDYPKLLGGGRLTHRAAHTDAMSGDDQVALAFRVDSRPAPSRIRVQARDFRRPHSDLSRRPRPSEPTSPLAERSRFDGSTSCMSTIATMRMFRWSRTQVSEGSKRSALAVPRSDSRRSFRT